jgi:hypothetical protein
VAVVWTTKHRKQNKRAIVKITMTNKFPVVILSTVVYSLVHLRCSMAARDGMVGTFKVAVVNHLNFLSNKLTVDYQREQIIKQTS